MDITEAIATLALITSVVALTYTVVVDRRRPRLKVTAGILHVFDRSPIEVRQSGPYFSISATNLGPGRVSVLGVGLAYRNPVRRWYRQHIQKNLTQGAVMDALPESPNQLPTWLDVGESLNLFFPPDSLYDCFYLWDSLGGKHWVPKGVFDSARASRDRADERMDT